MDASEESGKQRMRASVVVQPSAHGRIVVKVKGPLNGEVSSTLCQVVADQVRRTTRQLLVDLSATTCIEKDGVQALCSLAALTAKAEISFLLIAAHSGAAAAALVTSGMTELLEMFPDLFEILPSVDDA